MGRAVGVYATKAAAEAGLQAAMRWRIRKMEDGVEPSPPPKPA